MKNNTYILDKFLFRDTGTISLDDYMMVRHFFGRMGYDTSKNIHFQFCKKYGLKYEVPNER